MVFTKNDPNINRNGRPRGSKSLTGKIKDALEKIADGQDYTYEEAFIKAILKKAIVDQDAQIIKTIWEQFDGKPVQKIQGDFDGNININILGKSDIKK